MKPFYALYKLIIDFRAYYSLVHKYAVKNTRCYYALFDRFRINLSYIHILIYIYLFKYEY